MSEKFIRFAAISGLGLLLDVSASAAAAYLGAGFFAASWMGSLTGVTFVYFMSYFIFSDSQYAKYAGNYLKYLIWQVFSILVAAAAVAFLSRMMTEGRVAVFSAVADLLDIAAAEVRSMAVAVAKLLIAPISLIANFFFMKGLAAMPPKTRNEAR
ncbi:MAG: hypothetical protein AAF192_00170 [Pseudomonadota bacterium]